MKQSLNADQLYTRCPTEVLGFHSTEELDAIDMSVGQDRAISAIRYAIDMPHSGYNLFVAGSPGMGKLELVKEIIASHPHNGGAITDWCYVNNFDAPHQPIALKLPKGKGNALKHDMDKLIERLLTTLPQIFQGDDYRQRMNQMRDEYSEREEALFRELNERAGELDLAIVRTPHGFTIGPVRDGKMLSAKAFSELPENEQEEVKKNTEEINKKLQNALETINTWQEESMERVQEANNDFARLAIDPPLQKLKASWAGEERVLDYLERVHESMIENAGDFFMEESQRAGPPSRKQVEAPQFVRYRVNVLVDNSSVENLPMHHEDNPTYQNLVGRVEHMAEMGTLTTNFMLIKPGAVHLANGGYLVLDTLKLLTNGFSYPALKRVLSSGEIRIESIERVLSLVTTTTLEPECIPASFKVVLVGDRLLYHLLKANDPEFSLLFKIQADFSETLHRSPETLPQYARVIAGIVRSQQLLPFTADGVARVIEHSSRLVEDTDKLTLHRETIGDLIRESHYQARRSNAAAVERSHVETAIDQALYRSNRYQELIQEMIERGTLMVAVSGEHIAQVNALSVYQLGDFSFGRPTRITATARVGSGKVLDIERESELGGTIHSKGVMILSALLASRYARDTPLPLAATLVFEQSYGPIDGDSASVAELLALLSAVTKVPLKQSLAVTGSINQHGQVQAIGGVNEKIEGFFDICKTIGLSGDQGVVIPAANIRHLMLRADVVEGCRNGQFHVHAIDTLDDALEYFTGLPAGEPGADGRYTEGSFNREVQDSLAQFSEKLKEARGREDSKAQGGSGDD